MARILNAAFTGNDFDAFELRASRLWNRLMSRTYDGQDREFALSLNSEMRGNSASTS